jgi:hypothetical protein
MVMGRTGHAFCAATQVVAEMSKAPNITDLRFMFVS